jgi:hypothetical protein
VLEDRTLPSTFMVTNLRDSGDGSLRQAILDANHSSEENTIDFATTGTISLDSTLPELSTSMNILGPRADSLTVQRSTAQGTPEFSVFTISGPATVTLSGLTITNGSATLGGGIFNDGGTLTVSDCVLEGNSALRGGGITNFGSLIVSGSTLVDNAATSKGGGIANFGSSVITSSTLTGNSASTGGGIYNFDGAILTVSTSTLAGNRADFGGGLAMNGGLATVANSTLAGNVATYDGGGIDIEFGATLTLSNVIVSGNSALRGGGICNDGTLSCRDTILAGNTAADGPDVFGDLGSQGHNVIGDTRGCSGLDPSDLLNVDPIPTTALLPGSSAIGVEQN